MGTDVEVDALVSGIRRGLRAAADPGRAPQMQRYMKSAMPFLGVPVPRVRAIVTTAARAHPPADLEALRAAALRLWRESACREERYAATALLDTTAARRLRTPDLLPTYEELIRTGAWWDHVDELAHRVGELLRLDPGRVRPVVAAWARDDDRWVRRAAILCQLGARDGVDRGLLTAAIDANAADPDVVVRKAIGWALRDLARSDPDWVRAFVAQRAGALSPLSRREALKHLG